MTIHKHSQPADMRGGGGVGWGPISDAVAGRVSLICWET